MELEVTENGEVFLPVSLRHPLGIRVRDTLDVYEKDGEIVLSPKRNFESHPHVVDSTEK
ncbi:hypothetical protein BH24ACI3_BH24ACI3_14230 [soil metagenome]